MASHRCELPDCIEGTPIHFNLSISADAADFVEKEDWKPIHVMFDNVRIVSGGSVIATYGQQLNMTEGDEPVTSYISGMIPASGGPLELCFNKSVYGKIYAMNIGTAAGSAGGVVHSRNTFLFTWSEYMKPTNETCEAFAEIDVIPRASIECVRDSECQGAERCEDYMCEPVVCVDTCAQVVNHACTEPECCRSEECPAGQSCADKECKPLECGEGQLEEEHSCRDIVCGFLDNREGKECSLDLGKVSSIVGAVAAVVILLFLRRRKGKQPGSRRKEKWYR